MAGSQLPRVGPLAPFRSLPVLSCQIPAGILPKCDLRSRFKYKDPTRGYRAAPLQPYNPRGITQRTSVLGHETLPLNNRLCNIYFCYDASLAARNSSAILQRWFCYVTVFLTSSSV